MTVDGAISDQYEQSGHRAISVSETQDALPAAVPGIHTPIGNELLSTVIGRSVLWTEIRPKQLRSRWIGSGDDILNSSDKGGLAYFGKGLKPLVELRGKSNADDLVIRVPLHTPFNVLVLVNESQFVDFLICGRRYFRESGPINRADYRVRVVLDLVKCTEKRESGIWLAGFLAVPSVHEGAKAGQGALLIQYASSGRVSIVEHCAYEGVLAI